jgi:hypothetical protein
MLGQKDDNLGMPQFARQVPHGDIGRPGCAIVLSAALALGAAGGAAGQSPGSSLATPLPANALLLPRLAPTGQAGLGQGSATAPVPNPDMQAQRLPERKWSLEFRGGNGRQPPQGGAPTPASPLLPAGAR